MSLGSHQTSVGKSQDHITPKWVIDRLGPFELDPAAANPRPWDCATRNFTEAEDGLSQCWFGRVFLNPPFNRYVVGRWIERLAEHGCGTALLHARTEAGWFEPIWRSASAILFMADRLHFHRPDGTRQPANSGAPPILVAFGNVDAKRLSESGIAGSFVTDWALLPGQPSRQSAIPSISRSRSASTNIPRIFKTKEIATVVQLDLPLEESK
jgi:hypothetical protein